jgi:acid phosphatase type 7
MRVDNTDSSRLVYRLFPQYEKFMIPEKSEFRKMVGLFLLLAACGGSPSENHDASIGDSGRGSVTPDASVNQFDAGPRPDAGVSATDDVVIAVAGDISDVAIGAQKATSDLIVTGGYGAVLLLGDNQYQSGTFAEYNAAFDPTWGRAKALMYPAPGNHEYYTPNAAGYYQYFGARAGDPTKGYYSFNLGNWHLVALNTNDECNFIPCDANSAQVKWLQADLADNAKKCILAFWHHPRFNSGTSHGNFKGAQALWDTLYQARADLILNGHEHVYERFALQTPSAQPSPEGIRQFTVGTGGADFYRFGNPKANSEIRESNSHGILALTLKADRYVWKFISSDSNFTDSGESLCH